MTAQVVSKWGPARALSAQDDFIAPRPADHAIGLSLPRLLAARALSFLVARRVPAAPIRVFALAEIRTER